MRDKERLLDFDEPVSFLFSHFGTQGRLGQSERLSDLYVESDRLYGEEEARSWLVSNDTV